MNETLQIQLKLSTMNFNIPEIKITLTFDKSKSELHTLRNSQDIAEAMRQVFNSDTFQWTEEFILICLNRAHKIVGFYKCSSGGITGTVADPRVILTVALNCAATSIVVAHNHPSGNLKPSLADEQITKKIKDAAALLDITLLDHIILTEESYYSFADEGMLYSL